MSPRKQPQTLFKLSVKNSISLINCAINIIETKYPENIFDNEHNRETLMLRSYLTSFLPVRLFDVLCSQRTSQFLCGDTRNQLLVLTHPKMTVLRKSDLDNSIPLKFWLTILPNFSNLIILDLKFICCDEILRLVGLHCLQLQEINIVSRVDICKSIFNACALIRNVSDLGLESVGNLKKLKVLTMDPPRSEVLNKMGRCISQNGLIMLISKLPCLEDLRIDTCDLGSTLINTKIPIGPLGIRRVNYHFPKAAGMRKLVQICPNLTELSVIHMSGSNKDDVINEITVSDLRLNRLDLSFFTFNISLHRLLSIKGCNLTNFSILDTDPSLNFEALLWIGQCCPNLHTLCLTTPTPNLVIPKYFVKPPNMFSKLQMLTIGNGLIDFKQLLSFFLYDTNDMQTLVVKSLAKTKFDSTLLHLLEKGCFRNINNLWLDCTFEVSIETIIEMINLCDNMRKLTVDLKAATDQILRYICDNNLDLRLGSY